MDCADEASLVRHVLALRGIVDLTFDLVGRRVDVTYDPSLIDARAIVTAVAATGLGVHTHARGERVHDDHAAHGRARPRGRGPIHLAAAGGVLLLAGWAAEAWQAESWLEMLAGASHDRAEPRSAVAHGVSIAAYGLALATGLAPVLPRAFMSLWHLRLDMHVLVCLSALGAAAVGQWGEGASVAFLFLLAHQLESWSIERARVAVSDLVGHEPGWGEHGENEAGEAERWIERFASLYTPAVTASAFTLAIVPPLFDGEWATWFYRGLVFLVLACPCALVISTPVTVVASLTSAARRGVLYRGRQPWLGETSSSCRGPGPRPRRSRRRMRAGPGT
jgi:cation transport ATPase